MDPDAEAKREPVSNEPPFEALREQMLAEIEAQAEALADSTGVRALSESVRAALLRVPREEFVPAEIRQFAYVNQPLPIGFGKTISQPFIAALMTELLEVHATDRVLEIGTGLGYQAALLAELARSVYTVELIPELAAQAASRLGRQGYSNVEVRMGNGRLGWPEHAPFDCIVVTAAPDLIPPVLLQQLAVGGRMVLPAGIPEQQRLLLVRRSASGQISTRDLLPVRFSDLDEDAGPAGTG